MKFKVSPQIFKNFPGLKLAVITVKNISSNYSTEFTQQFLHDAQRSIGQELSVEKLMQHPYVHAWHDVYKSFDVNPKKYLVSFENLIKRVLDKKQIRPINAVVDIYNAISLKYMLPMGGEDLSTLVGDLELTYASDQEQAVLMLGEKEAHAPHVGEIFYKDTIGAVCRRWNWKEADRTKITQASQNIVLVVEALSVVDQSVLQTAIADLLEALSCLRGDISVFLLDQEKQEIVLSDQQNNTSNPLHKKDWIDLKAIYNLVSVPCKDSLEYESLEHQVRVKKVEQLRALGFEPWSDVNLVTATCKQIKDMHTQYSDDYLYAIAGRLMTIRSHGKTAFCTLHDATGSMQIYLKQDVVGQEQQKFFNNFIDTGDIVWCQGTAFVTKVGELTLKVQKITLLSKCLHPLPEKFHGIADIEIKYRQRYLDLITSTETRDRFYKRTHVIKLLRGYLDQRGYEEVETPMLHPIPGGAAARPFITHHNALSSDFYLRIAPELYLKRLMVGGIEKVYEINRNFRNEGVSTRHNPEFTMLEFYTAHKDYHYSMDFVEDMIKTVVQAICGALTVPFGDKVINFDNFQRLSPYQAVVRYGGLSEADLADDAIDVTCKKHNVVFVNISYYQKIFNLFEACAESKLVDPVFIVDFPIEISPLAKRDHNNPEIAARFELFIAGMEISNGFNELNDPFDQAHRFKQQAQAHASGDEEAMHYDKEYITALEYGMPPAVGVGIGVDRLTMLVTNTTSIKEIILFPAMKRKL